MSRLTSADHIDAGVAGPVSPTGGTRCPGGLAIALLLLAACAHDAPRENPLDPVLTPGVVLTASLQDSAGVVRLQWPAYRGAAEFGEYLLDRQRGDQATTDTLARLIAAEDTTWTDTVDPGVSYRYRLSVRNTAGHTSHPEEAFVPPFEISPVALATVDVSSASAVARLAWSPYAGPRFGAYRVLRREGDGPAAAVGELPDVGTTSFVDSHLVGNTLYSYSIAVVTDRGAQAVSAERSVTLYPLVASWPLDLQDAPFARLYAHPGGGVRALLAGRGGLRLLSYDPAGALLSEERLLPSLPETTLRSVAFAVTSDGTRWISLRAGSSPSLLAFDGDTPQQREATPFAEALAGVNLADLTPGVTRELSSEVALLVADGSAGFDNLAVTAGSRAVFEDSFETAASTEPWFVFQGEVTGGRAEFSRSTTNPQLLNNHVARLRGDGWQEPGVAADVILESGMAGLRLGGTLAPALALVLDLDAQQVTLQWVAADGAHQLVRPLLVLEDLVYRLQLGVDGDQVRAAVHGPASLSWPELEGSGSPWGALAGLGEGLVLAAGDAPVTVNADTVATPRPVLPGAVSEVRTWQLDGASSFVHWVGFCLPEANRVLAGSVNLAGGALRWPFALPQLRLGRALGTGDGEFIIPQSFDAGRDGRIYVLDTFNSRIQVFDPSGGYITQWGSRGSGAGEFDFGRGLGSQDFAGSVVVGEDGAIYVADVGNGRIQKFAP